MLQSKRWKRRSMRSKMYSRRAPALSKSAINWQRSIPGLQQLKQVAIPIPRMDKTLGSLRTKAETLKKEIGGLVDGLYNSKASVGDVSQSNLMDNYLASLKDYEETKAGLSGLEHRIQGAQKEYDNYAPGRGQPEKDRASDRDFRAGSTSNC